MSGGIRPLERRDLVPVAELYQRAMRSRHSPAPRGLAGYFERTLFAHPWADPELPSLVYETGEGRITGFIASHSRRVILGDRRLRMGISGQLVSDPEGRDAPVGALLMRRYLSGSQDLTITDGATGVVHEMWVRLGGRALYPASISWTRLLRRPAQTTGDLWLQGRRRRWRRAAQPLLSALDASAAPRFVRPPAADPELVAGELTPEALVEHGPDLLGADRLRVDYDPTFVEWLFTELGAVRTRGEVLRRILRVDGRVVGWYVTYLRPRGTSSVMAIAARRGAEDAVIDHLFAEAWAMGAAALEGRVELQLYEPLSRRRCQLSYGTRALFHSRHPDIDQAVALGGSALTRLDGEWWMGHHTEPFDRG